MKKKFENISCIFIIFLIILSFNSCFRDNGIPKANLEFIEFKKHYSKEGALSTYKIKFLSDVAISDEVFKKADTPHLTCLLTEKKDFTIKDIDNAQFKILGYFESLNIEKRIDSNKKSEYEIDIVFYDNQGGNIVNSPENDLKKLFLDKSCIPCKLEQRFFMETYKFYLSNSMCIPVEDILKVINE